MERLFLCGDSTMASYSPADTPIVGWGQVLAERLGTDRVRNHAMAGRSTRTFLQEGRLAWIEPELAPGDLLLIQFGHNDGGNKPERHTEPWGDFTENLTVFLDTAEAHGAQPVLLTPICVQIWEDGVLLPSHTGYLEAVHALAERRGVPLIDLYAESRRVVEALGPEASKALYLHLAPGEDVHFPDGVSDTTHTRRPGAERYAEIVQRALEDLALLPRGEERNA